MESWIPVELIFFSSLLLDYSIAFFRKLWLKWEFLFRKVKNNFHYIYMILNQLWWNFVKNYLCILEYYWILIRFLIFDGLKKKIPIGFKPCLLPQKSSYYYLANIIYLLILRKLNKNHLHWLLMSSINFYITGLCLLMLLSKCRKTVNTKGEAICKSC